MTDPRLHTRGAQLFGVELPIIQTGMGWVAYPRMVTAVSEAGGLGIIAGATLTFDQMVEAIDEVRAGTDKPFGVNVRSDAADIDKRLDHLITAEVRVASFANAPKAPMVAKLKEAGLITLPTVGAPRHAEKVAEMGVDAVIAQGAEGGGHTGSVPTSILIPQVVDATDLPVFAAGGFVDGRGLAAALAWGAEGIAMGTRFLLCAESQVPGDVKQIYFDTNLNGTVVTSAIDGAPQRVIRTDMIDQLEKARVAAFPKAAMNALRFRRLTGTSFKDLITQGLEMKKAGGLSWSQVALAANAPMLTKAAMVDGRSEVGILPTGQGLGVIDGAPTAAEILTTIADEAAAALDRLSGKNA